MLFQYSATAMIFFMSHLWTYKITQGLTPGQLDVAAHGPGVDTTVKKDQVLQALQWQYGKLRLQWKSLLSAQEERSKIHP